jgi:type IV pilus assembly protein PilQ
MKQFLLILVILSLTMVYSETLLNLSADLSVNEALQMIETISLSENGQKIYDLSNEETPLGFPIHNLTWKKALEIIALYHQLEIKETQNTIIVDKKQTDAEVQQAEETRQIKISATAFTVDKSFLIALGIDWSTLIGGEVRGSVSFSGAQQIPADLFQISGGQTLSNGQISIDIGAMLKTIESNQLGKVLAKPSILVTSGKKGYIQVGQDFSVKSVDDAGNTTDAFYSAGIILQVEPKILIEGDETVIQMVVMVERSSVVPGAVTTVINKSTSTTDLVLYDGEETVIGGLFHTEEVVERSGIPILKDLPWWVFGIRYLTGYDRKEINERELVIILQAEIMEKAGVRKLKNLSSQE